MWFILSTLLFTCLHHYHVVTFLCSGGDRVGFFVVAIIVGVLTLIVVVIGDVVIACVACSLLFVRYLLCCLRIIFCCFLFVGFVFGALCVLFVLDSLLVFKVWTLLLVMCAAGCGDVLDITMVTTASPSLYKTLSRPQDNLLNNANGQHTVSA